MKESIIFVYLQVVPVPVADPGFPVGGRRSRRGGADSQGGYVSKILYVKT